VTRHSAVVRRQIGILQPAELATASQRTEAARADHDTRTHRAAFSGCRIDALKGGSLTLSADGPEMTSTWRGTPPHFLSLKNADVAQRLMSTALPGTSW